MPNFLRLFCLLLVCLLLTGCFELKQTLVFQNSDSCIVSWNYRFPDIYSSALLEYEKGLARQQRDRKRLPWIMVLNRPVLEAWLKSHPDLELQNYSSYVVDGERKVQIVVACNHAMANLNRGIFGDIALRRNSLGDLHCTVKIPAALNRPGAGNSEKFLQGMKLNYIVSVPTALLHTNGRKDSFRSASWNWDFSQNPPQIPNLDKLDFSW